MYKKNKIKCICFVLLAVMIFVSLTEFAVYAETKTIKIGYVPNYGVINEYHTQGDEGFGYEFFEEISKYTDYTFLYIPVEWDEGLEKLETGEIDIFGPVDMNYARAISYDYLSPSFGYEDIVLYSHEDKGYYYQDTESFSNSIIGAYEDIDYLPQLEAYARENDFEYEIKYYEMEELQNAIDSGEVDLVMASNQFDLGNTVIVDRIGQEEFFYMTTKGNYELSEEIEKAVEIIYQEDPYFVLKLQLEYFNDDLAKEGITKEEHETLSQKEFYTVGYNVNHKPFTYTNSYGNADGHGVDIMREIAKQLDIKIRFVPLHDGENIDEQTLDMHLCIMNCSGTKVGRTVEPYSIEQMVLLRNNSIEYQDMKSIASIDYEAIDIEFHGGKDNDIKLIKTRSMESTQELLFEGEVDAILTSSRIANSILNFSNVEKYDIDYTEISVPLSITISDDLPQEVFLAVDKTVQNLDDEFVNGVIADNISEVQNEIETSQIFYRYRFQIISGVLALIGIVLLVFVLQMKQKQNAIRDILEIDKLTGFRTKLKFEEEVNRILKTAKPSEYMILTIDIDNFKSVNNEFGYATGDTLLKIFFEKVYECFGKDVILARSSGDILIAFLKNTFNGESICGKEKCDFCLQNSIRDGMEESILVSLSRGVYVIENPEENIDYMIDCAHVARLDGKKLLGSKLTVFTEEMRKRLHFQNSIVSQIEMALKNKELSFEIQPKYNLNDNRIVGAETLIRWNKEDGETMYPKDFIPILEANGYVKEIDLFVFEEVCKLIHNSEFELPKISVNISTITVNMEDVVKKYMDIINKYKNVQASQIELEITETAYEKNFTTINETMKQFKMKGFLIAVDDFGIGFSTLSRLANMDIDTLKIDRSLVGEKITDKNYAILESIIYMSKKLGLKSVAEGIETEEQKNTMSLLGCDTGQGYYFAKPMDMKEFLLLMKKNNNYSFDSAASNLVEIFGFEKMQLLAFDKMASGIIVCKNDEDYTIIEANPQFYKTIGYTRNEMIEIHQNKYQNITLDNIRNIIEEKININSKFFDLEYRIKTKEGEIRWLNTQSTYDEENDIFYIVVMDITNKLIYSEEEVSLDAHFAQREAHKNVIATMEDYIYIVNPSTKELLYINDSILKNLGNPPEEVWKNRKCYEFLLGKSEKCEACNYSKLEDGVMHIEECVEWGEKGQYYMTKEKLVELGNTKAHLNIVSNITTSHLLQIQKNSELEEHKIIAKMVTILQEQNLEEAINSVFKELMIYYDADRSCGFVLSESGKYLDKTFEQKEEGATEGAVKEERIPAELVTTWFEEFEKDGEILIRDIDKDIDGNRNEHKYLQNKGLFSLMLVPLYFSFSNKKIIGYISLDNPEKNIENTNVLKIAAKFIADSMQNTEYIKKIKYLGFHDTMTGTQNRNSFTSKIIEIEEHCEHSVGIIYADINNLKFLNDTEGHAKGDEVIVALASLLKKIMGNNVYRIGGDEFVTLLQDVSEAEFLEKVSLLGEGIKKNPQIDVAIGTIWCEETTDWNKKLEIAEKRMYDNKAKRKNNIK